MWYPSHGETRDYPQYAKSKHTGITIHAFMHILHVCKHFIQDKQRYWFTPESPISLCTLLTWACRYRRG